MEENKKCGGHAHCASCGSFGLLWVAGWLFTIGFLHLAFWKAVLAIVLWPYDLGSTFALTH